MDGKERLLIVDDEQDMLEGLGRLLAYELEGVHVRTFTSPVEAAQAARREPYDLALVDVKMPEMDGLDLLKSLKASDPWLTVIMMTAYGSIETAVAAIKAGAYDFITKPFEKEVLLRTLNKGLERNRLIRENLKLQEKVRDRGSFQNFVGESLPMRRLYERIQAVAQTDYTVLIRGESGTGKELVARSVHGLSKRAHRPLIAVNCPAIPEHLLESELFGHKRGAFTGADRDVAGLFLEADGGTVFLDEIGDIPVSVQTKLLRVLQEQEIKPLGAARSRRVNVRVIASTNQDLESRIRSHSFREDLFYRLNVMTLWTPSLRDIPEDIPLLVDHYTRVACEETGGPSKRFSLEAMQLLARRRWPGNVRELQNVVRRAVMFSPDAVIRREDLEAVERLAGRPEPGEPVCGRRGSPSDGVEPYKDAKERVLHEFTDEYVRRLMEVAGGNVSRAAEMSGLTRAALQKILRRMSIPAEAFREQHPS